MNSAHIVCAKAAGLFGKAQAFVLAYELFSCALMQKILLRTDDVFVILNAQENVLGVFSFSQGGTILSCLPIVSADVVFALKDFFLQKDVWCLSGKKDFVDTLKTALLEPGEKSAYRIIETRSCLLLRHITLVKKEIACLKTARARIVHCIPQDAPLLMPLHAEYVAEEVLPRGFSQSRAATFLMLEKALKARAVYAVKLREKEKDLFVSKAHITALGSKYLQVGGVYTIPEYRHLGFAQTLLVALLLKNPETTCVLYVRKENVAALRLYTKVGFAPAGEYEVTYLGKNEAHTTC